MVGMDAPVYIEKSKERDCLCVDPLKPRAQAKGEAAFSSKYFEPPTGAIGGEGNGKVAALCPITPTPRGENGDSVFVSSTPLSLESPQSPNLDSLNSASNYDSVASGFENSPRTPEEGVFDPFAQGPDELLLAPICKKLLNKTRTIVARQLNFDDVGDFPEVTNDAKDMETLSEKMLLDAVYGTLLEAIVINQTEDFLAGNQPLEMKNLHTPPSSPCLTGIAETCPGAPMKAAASKSRNVDPGLCRKLEF